MNEEYLLYFPAGLSLVIELMFTKAGPRPQWDVKQIIKSLPTDEVQNPVVYRLVNRDNSMTRTFDSHLVCLQGASDRHDLSCCGPHTLQVTILLLVAALQYVLLFHDPFYVYPSVSERILLHIVDDHRLVIDAI